MKSNKWIINDIFALQLKSELAKEKGFYGRYVLIQIVDKFVCPNETIAPIVYVKITDTFELPKTEKEINELSYIQVKFTRYEERYNAIDFSCYEEDIARKSKICYKTDEYGFLPQYRLILLKLSEKIIKNELIYLGNYNNIDKPALEFIPHDSVNMKCIVWKQRLETFETRMIKLYCGHNLRELSVYQTNS